jgi:hypothetical protein
VALSRLADRFEQLPRLLVGPILRQVEEDVVAVWFVFKTQVTLTLSLYQDDQEIASEATASLPFGPHFHICCAKLSLEESNWLKPGQIYEYDFVAQVQDGQNLTRQELIGESVDICLKGFDRPSFLMPPEDINEVRFAFGSCRKPHGEGRDMLPHLAKVLDQAANSPGERPQQLFMMGDQIYADDVSAPLLALIMDANSALLASPEILPEINQEPVGPGKRLPLIKKAGFTSSHGHSHLFWLGEFLAMYAFVWSPALWPKTLPDKTETEKITGEMTSEAAKVFQKHYDSMQAFRDGLSEVQRTLANIPTYMIADDHEVTDDWYLNRDWTHRVISNPIGRHLLTNGICAYMVCQHWGNQPRYFEIGPGKQVLQLTQSRLSGADDASEVARLETLCGIPEKGKLPLSLDRDPQETVLLHYRVQAASHEVWVLDTRTWRGFHERHEKDIPDLLSCRGWDQLYQGERNSDKLVVIVAPTNVIDLPATATVSKWIGRMFEPTHADYGDSWETQTQAFEHLLGKLTTNSYANGNQRSLVILSGDVHYGFAARIHYRGKRPYKSESPSEEIQAVMAHLTSSAFHNENKFTRLFHRWGYWPRLPWVWAWAGWHNRPEIKTSSFRGRVKALFQLLRTRSLKNDPPLLNLANLPREIKVSDQPDWRYRIDFLAGEHNPDSELPKPKGKREGRDIVGVNNFGVLRFHWPEEANDRRVLQELYWMDREGNTAARTQFSVSLGFEGKDAPAIPDIPIDPT